MSGVRVEHDGAVTVVTIDRPEVRNAVDRDTAEALAAAFRAFDDDPECSVAVLTGTGGVFCAAADLHAVAGGGERMNRLTADGDGPLGLARLQLGKPVIAAVEGHAVAGAFELALWCDLRVASETAVFGVFCRRWGCRSSMVARCGCPASSARGALDNEFRHGIEVVRSGETCHRAQRFSGGAGRHGGAADGPAAG